MWKALKNLFQSNSDQKKLALKDKLLKISLFPVMWKDALISKYHTDPITVDTMQAMSEKYNSNCEAKASPATDPEAFLLLFFFYGKLVE